MSAIATKRDLRAANERRAVASDDSPALLVARCREQLARRPGDPELLHRLGVAAFNAGDLETALTSLSRALESLPRDAELLRNHGVALQRAGRLADAETTLAAALEQAPDDDAVWFAIGNLRFARGHYEPAHDAFARATALAPDHVEARTNLGVALKELGRLDEAEAELRNALLLDPEHTTAINGLGAVFEARGQEMEAAAQFARAFDRDTGYTEALFNLTTIVRRQSGDDAALALLRDADRMAPNARIRWAMSIILLTNGRLEEGWRLFDEGIGQQTCRPPDRPFAQQRGFDGARRALLWGEQGLGEEILFSSMVPDLIARGVTGVLECDSRLVPLLARSFPEFKVVARLNEPDPATRGENFDIALPTASLGGRLRSRFEAFPSRPRYLVADQQRVAQLRARYRPEDGRPLVGISWVSGARKLGAAKSMTLEAWGPILRTRGVAFRSLQYGPTAATIERVTARLGTPIGHDLTIDPVLDLDAFAAQVAAMDLVVTVSNTTAHVAGALGVPCIVLIPQGFGGLWHWFTGREDSPWYPSVSLLRQLTPGDWRAPIAAAASRVEALARHTPTWELRS